MKQSIQKLLDLQIQDYERQDQSKTDIQELQHNLNLFVKELSATRENFKTEIYSLKLLLAEDYVHREGYLKFADKMVDTLDRLNTKIDASCLEYTRAIIEGDKASIEASNKWTIKLIGVVLTMGGIIGGLLMWIYSHLVRT